MAYPINNIFCNIYVAIPFFFFYNAIMKVKELIKLMESDGWYLVKTSGSHRQFKHLAKKGRVTVSGKLSKDMPVGTEKSVLKQAQLD